MGRKKWETDKKGKLLKRIVFWAKLLKNQREEKRKKVGMVVEINKKMLHCPEDEHNREINQHNLRKIMNCKTLEHEGMFDFHERLF